MAACKIATARVALLIAPARNTRYWKNVIHRKISSSALRQTGAIDTILAVAQVGGQALLLFFDQGV